MSAASPDFADRFKLAERPERPVRVLYDRPASTFTSIDRLEREQIRQALFVRLGIRNTSTLGFLVCPTSWTADEDFDLIIDAVPHLEDRIRDWEAVNAKRRFPDLVVLVTGDGNRRAEFERRFAGLPARRVQLRTRWLELKTTRASSAARIRPVPARSSSGADIPMKVADLFGVGVPHSPSTGACLAERVRHGINGRLFLNALGGSALLPFQTFPPSVRARSLESWRAVLPALPGRKDGCRGQACADPRPGCSNTATWS